MKSNMQFTVAAAALIALAGCGKNQPNTTPPDQPPDQATALKDMGDRSRDAFIASAETRLKALDAKIDELGQKAASLKDDAKTQADQMLTQLRGQREKLGEQFAALKQAGSNVWAEARSGFETALDKLAQSFEQARTKLD